MFFKQDKGILMSFFDELGKHIKEKFVLNTFRDKILSIILVFSLTIHQDLLLTGFIFGKALTGV